MSEQPAIVLTPQPGPQWDFLASPADIAIYGGAAFGGKTWALLMECLRPVSRRGFNAVIFRRTYPQITNSGGLWDSSMDIYANADGKPKPGDLTWEFPSGHTIAFRHLQHEKDKLSWQGAAVPLLCFDELTHFTRGQFFYMLSRNRMFTGDAGRPYVRATCNPDADSWVADFIAWWIDQGTGLPVPERAGAVRWMARDGDDVHWADSKEELDAKGFMDAKSVTFVPAKITDNKAGLARDPGYLGNLKALPLLEREQLLMGNWKIRPVSGMFFRRDWFKLVEVAPADGRTVRYWDRAATEATARNADPDWTVGMKARRVGDKIVILDVCRFRGRPEAVLQAVKNCAKLDGEDCEQWLEEDPGQAGKAERALYYRELADVNLRFLRPRGSKVQRAMPASAQAEGGNIEMLRAPWVESLWAELEAFADWDVIPKDDHPPVLPHDDQVDALSGLTHVLLAGGAGVSITDTNDPSESK